MFLFELLSSLLIKNVVKHSSEKYISTFEILFYMYLMLYINFRFTYLLTDSIEYSMSVNSLL